MHAGVAKVADIVANLALHYKHTRVPADVALRNVDMVVEMEGLSFALTSVRALG